MLVLSLPFTAAFSGIAQNDLGKVCGCPPISSRGTPVNISNLPGYSGDFPGAPEGRLTQGAILDCNHIYLLDVKVSIPSGQTIKIEPGAVIKGRYGTFPNSFPVGTSLIIERGGKIDASGTSACPIVFTAEADPLNNTYALGNIEKWGGLVILGKATNNLTAGCNGYAGFTPDRRAVNNGLGAVLCFDPANSKYWFGADINGGESFNDNDNSGTLKYVSIRHAGKSELYGKDLDALTLASVGRGTMIDHINIVSSADDGISFLGGTVNVKYISAMFCNDDMFDWDLGYTGKAQFVFGMKATTSTSVDADNGFEGDGDDNLCRANTPRSKPVIYNATFVGNAKITGTSDNSSIAGINVKEGTQGEIHNSVFTDFKNGLNLVSTGAAPDALQEWNSGNLIITCNTFVNCTNDLTVNNTLVPPPDATRAKFVLDKNTTVATAASIGMATPFLGGANPLVDVIPVLQSTADCPVAPVDGFFTPTSYRGAFSPAGKSWLFEWSTANLYIKGLQPCPTDVTSDGQTTNADLSQILLEFGKACK